MSPLLWACIVLLLLVLALSAALLSLLPRWLDERARRIASDDAAERLRQRVREVRAEADATKDALTRCHEAAAAVEAAARKAGDAVDIANAIIAGAPREAGN